MRFFAIFAPMTYVFGQIECYFAGCCWGIPTDAIWGVVFPLSRLHPTYRVVHPVQLYDSYLNFLLFLFLLEYRDKKRFEGELFLLFLVGNSIIRFFVEYFRWGVSAKVVLGFITQAQIASIVIILGSLVFWKILKEKQKIV
ncbi:MAG: prolipoprotein diacylglyceryl transferase [Candidatus Aenigmatarchaeota archaeon]